MPYDPDRPVVFGGPWITDSDFQPSSGSTGASAAQENIDVLPMYQPHILRVRVSVSLILGFKIS
jgi:hypothetical protein